jgi:uncharacterized membrane protein HdeD (DUF308 family)
MECGMENKPAKKNNWTVILFLLAGILYILAAFHPFTNETGIDYINIPIGVVFLAIGIAEWRAKNK